MRFRKSSVGSNSSRSSGPTQGNCGRVPLAGGELRPIEGEKPGERPATVVESGFVSPFRGLGETPDKWLRFAVSGALSRRGAGKVASFRHFESSAPPGLQDEKRRLGTAHHSRSPSCVVILEMGCAHPSGPDGRKNRVLTMSDPVSPEKWLRFAVSRSRRPRSSRKWLRFGIWRGSPCARKMASFRTLAHRRRPGTPRHPVAEIEAGGSGPFHGASAREFRGGVAASSALHIQNVPARISTLSSRPVGHCCRSRDPTRRIRHCGSYRSAASYWATMADPTRAPAGVDPAAESSMPDYRSCRTSGVEGEAQSRPRGAPPS